MRDVREIFTDILSYIKNLTKDGKRKARFNSAYTLDAMEASFYFIDKSIGDIKRFARDQHNIELDYVYIITCISRQLYKDDSANHMLKSRTLLEVYEYDGKKYGVVTVGSELEFSDS